jgi:hypothetical protein
MKKERRRLLDSYNKTGRIVASVPKVNNPDDVVTDIYLSAIIFASPSKAHISAAKVLRLWKRL